MPLLALLSVLLVAGLARLVGRAPGRDVPERIVAVAASGLPAHRQDWGRAMAAELAHVRGRACRWRFATGVLRVVIFLPPRRRNRALVAGLAGLVAAAAATVAAARSVPSLSVFVAVLGLLLAGYAIVATSRPPQPHPSAAQRIVSAVALGGVAVSVIAVVRIAAAHPAATADHYHVFSVFFALTLTGYLALTLTPPHLSEHAAMARWWALGAALASGAAWAFAALIAPGGATGIAVYLWPVGGFATLTAAAGAAAAAGSGRVGAQAGMLCAILGAPLHFTLDLTVLANIQHYSLTNAYDIAAYPHSGYPDVASYILSDAVAGDILAGLVLYPVTLLAVAAIGAAAGSGLRRLAARPAARVSPM